MPTFLLVFEFLGTTELLVIAVVALIIFGPRKLPEIGRTIGRSLAEFKRASEDFKRTWEYEVDIEKTDREKRDDRGESISRRALVDNTDASAAIIDGQTPSTENDGATIPRDSLQDETTAVDVENDQRVEEAFAEPTSKKDWL